MIDASRLGHSLATALKDRPHGMPIQPNRSLPLRPPPPIPKKNSPIAQVNPSQKATGNNGNCADKNCVKDIPEDGNVRTNDGPSLGVVGMNFYDSKDEEDNSNDKSVEDFAGKTPKELYKYRHTKSLDHDTSNENNRGTKRRKSFECGTISRDGDTCKKRNTMNNEWEKSGANIVPRERKKRGKYKKRKSSNAEDNHDGFRKEKIPRVLNVDAVEQPLEKLKPVPLSGSQEPQSFESVRSSGVVLPTIFKYRNTESTSPPMVDKNINSDQADCTVEKSSWKQTSTNTYKLILPKPPNIPKCPAAIPIDVAHAMHQEDSRNTNINSTSYDAEIRWRTSQCVPIKPKISVEKSRRQISQTVEDVENTLPSMPILEDSMQADGRQDKLTLHRNQGDFGKAAATELMPMVEARVLQAAVDLTSKTKNLEADEELVKENTNTISNDHNCNMPRESIVNLTTVLEIKIPGRSPELIILQAPQIMSNGKGDSIANNSPVEATTPVSLSTDIQSALEDSSKIEDSNKINTSSGLKEYRKENHWEYETSQEKISQEKDTAEADFLVQCSLVVDRQQQSEDLSGKDEPQYTLQHKSPVEIEVLIKDPSGSTCTQELVQGSQQDESMSGKPQGMTKEPLARPKEDRMRARRNRYNLKLRKLYEEEAHLKSKMSQTSDPSRLTRLQQKINCAAKKIENTQKYLNKVISIKTPGECANSAPSRIQVRQDLVQKIPSPESIESTSGSPLRPTDDTDKASTTRSPPVSSPIVITISETDSASSGEETDTSDGKSADTIKANFKSDAEIKLNDAYVSENDTKVASITGCPSPDDKPEKSPLNAIIEMMNNNVEYLNKNLPPVCEGVPASVNTETTSIPRGPVSLNTDLTSIPRVSAIVNTPSIIIPPLIRDPINYSLNDLNSVPNQKSPSLQYAVPNSNLPPNRVDNEQNKPNYDCLPYLRGNAAAVTKSSPKYEANNFAPNTVSDLRTPSTIRRTAIQEHTNAHPVSNYPVQRADYRTNGNVPSMFSRDNGGANINLSSPLQGHSALPFPPTYYRNLTAQGYPIPAEPSPNHQTTQWQNQHPPTKSSMQFTPDQDTSLHSSILATHLLKSQAQEPVNFDTSMKLSSLAHSKDLTRTNPAKHSNSQIMTAQFPTLGNWAAQMTRESTTRKSVDNSVITDRTGYKPTGSDMYKMAATAIDPTHPSPPENTIHWAQQKLRSEQPRPIQSFSVQRSIPRSYQRDYPPNSQIPHNLHSGPAKYPGSEVFIPYPTNPYLQASSGPQSTRSADHPSSQSSHGHQHPRQYQHPSSSQRPLVPATYQNQGNSPHLVNPLGMMQQQYLQQPPSYVQTMLSQWHSANSYKSYVNSQFNGFNGQTKPMDNNSTAYRPKNRNIAPMQPQNDTINRHFIPQNVPNVKLSSSMYNIAGNLNPVIQDARNSEPLDLGRSYVAQHKDKVRKSVDKSSSSKCSRCGMPGPKFNCFGCETAFYCNEQCQAQHWNTHFKECPKKMPKLKKVS